MLLIYIVYVVLSVIVCICACVLTVYCSFVPCGDSIKGAVVLCWGLLAIIYICYRYDVKLKG